MMIWSINNLDVNNVSLDDNDFGNRDPEIIIHAILMSWCNRHKQCKTCKKR